MAEVYTYMDILQAEVVLDHFKYLIISIDYGLLCQKYL